MCKHFFAASLLPLLMSWPVVALGAANPQDTVEHMTAAPATSAEDLSLLEAPAARVSKEGDAVDALFGKSTAAGVRYEAFGLPPGLTLDTATGAVTGTLSGASAADYYVTIRAVSALHSEFISFPWVVLDVTLPMVASPGLQLNTAGDEVRLQLAGADASGDAVTFSASGLPAGLSIDKATGLVTGKLADSNLRTTYILSVTASDGHSVGGTVFTWVVLPNK